jgi:hypothetical protein
MAKMMVFIAEQNKNYMFRPISAIIRFSRIRKSKKFKRKFTKTIQIKFKNNKKH